MGEVANAYKIRRIGWAARSSSRQSCSGFTWLSVGMDTVILLSATDRIPIEYCDALRKEVAEDGCIRRGWGAG